MMTQSENKVIGVLTSGGDAPGMNAALRSVVRAALSMSAKVFAIYEGYQGMVDGGSRIREMQWNDVGGIMQSPVLCLNIFPLLNRVKFLHLYGQLRQLQKIAIRSRSSP